MCQLSEKANHTDLVH